MEVTALTATLLHIIWVYDRENVPCWNVKYNKGANSNVTKHGLEIYSNAPCKENGAVILTGKEVVC